MMDAPQTNLTVANKLNGDYGGSLSALNIIQGKAKTQKEET